MATIAGPKVEMPPALSQMFETDEKGQILALKPEWASFFHSLQNIAWLESRSGPTASRPTSSTTRFVGMKYFDTSLGASGKPVFLAIASSNAWVLADGTAA